MHCFYCNAQVEDNVECCPGCGRQLARPAGRQDGAVGSVRDGESRPRMARRPVSLGERVRLANHGRRRGYMTVVLVLGMLAAVSAVFLRTRDAPSEVPRPGLPEVDYAVFEIREHPAGRVERRSAFARVRPGLPADSLRAALDWLVYRTVDERNRVERGNLRVVWAYLYDEETASLTGWRAMAIWQMPGLTEAVRPSGIGGEAFREGNVQYALANRLLSLTGGADGR